MNSFWKSDCSMDKRRTGTGKLWWHFFSPYRPTEYLLVAALKSALWNLRSVIRQSSLLSCHRVRLCRVDIRSQDLLQGLLVRHPERRTKCERKYVNVPTQIKWNHVDNCLCKALTILRRHMQSVDPQHYILIICFLSAKHWSYSRVVWCIHHQMQGMCNKYLCVTHLLWLNSALLWGKMSFRCHMKSCSLNKTQKAHF